MDTVESIIEVANAEDRYRTSFNSIYTSETRGSIVDKVDYLAEDSNLDKLERLIITSWIENGIRFDTGLWMRTLKTHWGDNEYVDNRIITSALFIDIFNRADDVFDEFRDQHKGDDGQVNTHGLESLPIIKCNDGSVGTVGEFMKVLRKIVNESKEYSRAEQITINNNISSFLKISTEAIRQYETVTPNTISYGLDEALALRYQTLNPLVRLANDLYQRENTPQSDSQKIRNEMVALAIAVQWLDDRNDWEEDLRKGNVNLVLGVFSDHLNENKNEPQVITLEDLDPIIKAIDGEENNYGELLSILEREIEENYQRYYEQVHPDQKQFIPESINL